MTRFHIVYFAWVSALVVLALFCAVRPEAVGRLMLRNADTRLGKALDVRARIDSPRHARQTRLIAILVGCIGILMLLVGIFGSIKPVSRN